MNQPYYSMTPKSDFLKNRRNDSDLTRLPKHIWGNLSNLHQLRQLQNFQQMQWRRWFGYLFVHCQHVHSMHLGAILLLQDTVGNSKQQDTRIVLHCTDRCFGCRKGMNWSYGRELHSFGYHDDRRIRAHLCQCRTHAMPTGWWRVL